MKVFSRANVKLRVIEYLDYRFETWQQAVQIQKEKTIDLEDWATGVFANCFSKLDLNNKTVHSKTDEHLRCCIRNTTRQACLLRL